MTFYEKLNNLCINHGTSVTALAVALGYSRSISATRKNFKTDEQPIGNTPKTDEKLIWLIGMYYNIYKNIRDSAWRCLIDNSIDRLPIDILKIAHICDIRVIKNFHVNLLDDGEDAKALCYDQKWVIIYNERNDTAVSRFAIAHELGHIFLGHDLTYAKYENIQEFVKKPKSEQQADMFASRLLCPACIIMYLGLISPEDISDTCKVPPDIAKARSERMQELYKKNKFFSNELEKTVFENFGTYLSKRPRKFQSSAQNARI